MKCETQLKIFVRSKLTKNEKVYLKSLEVSSETRLGHLDDGENGALSYSWGSGSSEK